MQVPFLFIEANRTEKKCEYFSDFIYYESKTGKKIIGDIKSDMTRKLPVYIMNRKLMKSVHGIEI